MAFRQIIQQFNFEVPQVVSVPDFTSQFYQLVQTLKTYRTLGPAFRSVVIGTFSCFLLNWRPYHRV